MFLVGPSRTGAIFACLGVVFGAPNLAVAEDSVVCALVGTITVIPMKEVGDDSAYLELIQSGNAVLPALVDCVTDETPMPGPRQAPIFLDTKVGDVAFWVFLEITGAELESFLPDEYQKKWESDGIYAYFAYVEDSQNRRSLQAELSSWLNANET